ncbi:MAG: hypothetical protein GXY65_02340 [Rhodococcus sp.]|uniref:hypothetical protein n=1 Tax=Rhodococcus TaxID=1827 RepID=UPI001693414C|nr:MULTISPECIES: hypothetical protein [Rhodococcus]NLV78183.1 hypothetical protein [Rhodococcus sp. (in: high G+C Gram-positive bacteria)]
MQALAVGLFPVLLMLFALAMERVESRLSRLSVREQEVEEFLDNADHADVATLAREGFPGALARFHRRRRRSAGPDSDRAGARQELSSRRAS